MLLLGPWLFKTLLTGTSGRKSGKEQLRWENVNIDIFSQWRSLIGSSSQGCPPWEPLGHRARGWDAAAAGDARDLPLPREAPERSRGGNSACREREVPRDTQNKVPSVPRPCAEPAERSRKGMENGKGAWMWGGLQGKASFPLSRGYLGDGDVADPSLCRGQGPHKTFPSLSEFVILRKNLYGRC